MFSLRIKTDNAAFHEDDGTETADAMAAELNRILHEVGKSILTRLDGDAASGPVRDINGNNVGNWIWSNH